MNLELLKQAVSTAPAIRYRVQYQPTAGPGGKVYPALFSDDGQGGIYAKETRVIGGDRVPCVLVDSVPSQANRLEEKLAEGRAAGAIRFPTISVDLSKHGRPIVSSLDLPHRVADAYLTYASFEGTPWPKHARYREIANCGPRHATALFLEDPTSLLFGVWFSHDKNAVGRFGRLLVSELIAINAEEGRKTASRLDPLGSDTAKTIDAKTLAAHGMVDSGQKGDKKLSELGFGNVLPTVGALGGVTCSHVLQTATISLSGIRRLSFPNGEGKTTIERDKAARCVLAAMGLYALESTIADGVWLRSGCDLVADEKVREVVTEGPFDLDSQTACQLFKDAVQHAESEGLNWGDGLVLDGDTEVLAKRFETLVGGGK